MTSEIINQICKLYAFQSVFEKMSVKDYEKMNNISLSIVNSVEEYHNILLKPESGIYEKKTALLQEQIMIQALASKYLNINEELTQKEGKLWKAVPEITELFFDALFDKLDLYFQKKLIKIYKDIEDDAEWYSGIRDTAKKAGTIMNWAVKKANDISKDMTGSTLTQKNEYIDDRSIVEKVLEKHLDPNKVSEAMTRLMGEAGQDFQKRWEVEIKSQTPNFERLSAFSMVQTAKSAMNIEFNLGAAEQTFMIEIGSAVVGTLGLAAGWHTITYALLNVFPPIALFAVAAAILLGVANKDKAILQRKKQAEEAVKHFHRHFMMQFDITPLEHLKHQTLRKYMNQTSGNIVTSTIKQWEKQLFGALNLEDYRMLVSAFSHHLLLIQEALEELEDF